MFTIGINSFGIAFVAGKNLDPKPATGKTAFLIFFCLINYRSSNLKYIISQFWVFYLDNFLNYKISTPADPILFAFNMNRKIVTNVGSFTTDNDSQFVIGTIYEDGFFSPLNDDLMIHYTGESYIENMIDYIESLDVKVNTICRGRAFSAAAIILSCGTGTRMMSKRSTVMFHQSSSFLGGKMSDITAYLDNVKTLEVSIYEMLASRTKKDAAWWKDNMKSDLYLSAEELLEIGVIDQII